MASTIQRAVTGGCTHPRRGRAEQALGVVEGVSGFRSQDLHHARAHQGGKLLHALQRRAGRQSLHQWLKPPTHLPGHGQFVDEPLRGQAFGHQTPRVQGADPLVLRRALAQRCPGGVRLQPLEDGGRMALSGGVSHPGKRLGQRANVEEGGLRRSRTQ